MTAGLHLDQCAIGGNMFGSLLRRLAGGNRPAITQALRISINKLDIALALQEVDQPIATTRAAIYAGAALVKDVVSPANGKPLVVDFEVTDFNAICDLVARAHRAAVVGLPTVALGSEVGSEASPMHPFFHVHGKTSDDNEAISIIADLAIKDRDAALTGVGMLVVDRFQIRQRDGSMSSLAAAVRERYAEFSELTASRRNTPYLHYLHANIL